MCGRFTLRRPQRIDPGLLGVEELPPLDPRFNIAPGEDILLVRARRGAREASLAHWGLIPSWANDPSIGNRMANARGDSLEEKASFRKAWHVRRGLVIADGFYEWRSIPGVKRRQPYFVRMADDSPFAFGALWEVWRARRPDAEWVVSCSLITTEPNALLADIHDRMPVIVPPADWPRWLGETGGDRPPVDLLRPSDPDAMVAWPVSTRVNTTANDDEDCIAPLASAGA